MIRPRNHHDDVDLARRVAAGDPDAFAALDARHRAALTRYAGSLLRRSEHDAEDVVQDVLIRAHAALVAGEVPVELRPWLFRLTRNRAIDEVRRARWGEESFDSETIPRGEDRGNPEAVLTRKETMRRLVDDLADLPVRQRTALLACELDGRSAKSVAAELGVSVPAAQMLATRARQNLLRATAARDAACAEIGAALLDAHERGVRPTEHALRHVKGCDVCTVYHREIGRLSRRLHSLDPAFAVPVLGGILKLVAGAGTKTAVGVAAAVVLAASGGVVVAHNHVFGAGDPAPFVVKGIAGLTGHAVTRGAGVPGATAIVTAAVHLPAGAPGHGASRGLRLSCPSAMKLAGMEAPEQRLPIGYGLTKSSVIGYSSGARITFGQGALPRSYDVTVGILCRRPGPSGSLLAQPRLPQPGERAGRICVDDAEVYYRPGGAFVGNAYRGEPVSVQRRSGSGAWTRIVSDLRVAGWVRTNVLCR
jgi:RNA polymerase sigma factor (sigma-70 family)